MRHLGWLLLVLIALATGPTVESQDLKLPLKEGSVRFGVIGDNGTGESPQYETAQRMQQTFSKFAFTFVIMLGDNIYGGKTASDMRRKFDIPYKPFTDAGVLFYASLGNHDDTNQRFYKLFNMNGERYYTYKKGNMQFFALDSNYMDPTQLAWLQKELSTSKSDWKICYFHHPLYSSGAFHGSSTELRGILEPMFLKYGVQVVFSGHEHFYERIKPQKGIAYFIIGNSAKLRKGDITKTDLTAKGWDQGYAYMLMEISGDDLFYQVLGENGQTIDEGSVSRTGKTAPNPGQTTQPVVPTSGTKK